MSQTKGRGRNPRRIAADIEDELVARYQAGENIAGVAAELGIAKGSIYNILARRGVETGRPRTGPRRVFTPDELERAVTLRRAGYTIPQLQQAMGVGAHVLLRELRAVDRDLTRKARRHDAKSRIPGRDGYMYVIIPKGDMLEVMLSKRSSSRYLAEHRVLMARHLGRPLAKHETVHHINGIRDDNRLENLQLRQGHHGRGARYVCHDCGSHNVAAVPLPD